jgi:hypothetical protein
MTEQPKRRALIDIARDIQLALEASEGEIDARLDALDLELQDKVEAYAVVMRELDKKSSAFLELAAAYKVRAQQAENEIERLKERLNYGMQQAGVDDIKTRTAHAFYKTTTCLQLDNELDFIERYRYAPGLPPFIEMREVYKLSKTVLRAELEEGREYEGARLVTNRHLQLR